MRKYTQGAIKDYIRTGAAVDINNHDNAARAALEAQENGLEKVGYSSGVYGLNGGLLQGRKTGTLYAITARNTALFIYF